MHYKHVKKHSRQDRLKISWKLNKLRVESIRLKKELGSLKSAANYNKQNYDDEE